jgi:hypothetical protein
MISFSTAAARQLSLDADGAYDSQRLHEIIPLIAKLIDPNQTQRRPLL